MYVDESGIDNREDYGYGWNEKGERYYDLKSGKRSGRVSIISGLCQGELLGPLTFEGSCNRAIFENWLSSEVLPLLKPGSTIILDNATFHKSTRIKELIESAECDEFGEEKMRQGLLHHIEVASHQHLMMDPASFSKPYLRELQYLPPYSPDLNEIEHYWFPIKNRVRKSQGTIEDFRERVDTSVRKRVLSYTSTAIPVKATTPR